MLTDNMLAEQEEVKLAAMQRVWQHRRMPSSSSIFEEPVEYEDPFTPMPQVTSTVTKGRSVSPPPAKSRDCFEDLLEAVHEQEESVKERFEEVPREPSSVVLDASSVGDLPASYTIYGLERHQLPVVGVYVDKRVCPGFKYKVLPLPGADKRRLPYLFEGRALTLGSIGRGYARRFTFEADKNCLNDNENYFWSDNRPEGFGFELELVSSGDKFTVFDANHEAQGTLEIVDVEGPQVEISHETVKDGIKKKARVNFIGKVEFYETGVAKPTLMTGVVISIKKKGVPTAQVTKVINVTFKNHRYYLTPGIHKIHRRVTVKGEDIGDIPTMYTMTGLEPYEIPIVGTYVDPRIVPGFYYRVRPNDRKEHLFEGRALKLQSIGMGYAKRLTFEPDSLLEPDNFLWSDNHPDGLGLEPRAVHTGMKFAILADDQILGEAKVFRVDLPQQEERMEKVMTPNGKYAIEKYIHINVTCHVKLAQTGGHSDDREEHLMRVYGLAVARKEPKSSTAKVIRVENVGLDSQLNLLFARTHTELTFLPLN